MTRRFAQTGALIIATALALATPASAEVVSSKDAFVKLVNGKTLTRPLVKMQVTPGGRITGRGASWDITGNWTWKGGYFCRTLVWGGDDLGYNCQQVKSEGGKIRFTSDKGSGDSASFSLR